jgi:hypoxanthine phosphoribosyltransferase
MQTYMTENLTKAQPVETPKTDGPPKFAHPSEKEFAQILDFYGLKWDYEPRSFPLRWEGEKVLEMLTPDFYLPEMELYLELTTMKQSLVTHKNRKIRLMKEIYPEISVKLLYRKDFHRILAKFGFGPLIESGVKGIDRVLLTERQIAQKVDELAKKIARDYAQKQPVLVGVQRGMVCFMADLMRKLPLPLMMDFMSVSDYGGSATAGVRITKDLDIDLAGHDVLLIEDIVDTGMTLNYLLGHLRSKGAASVEVCTLLNKRARRIADVPIKYTGFEVPDEFLVGYGLDHMEKYRNLPFVAVLKAEGG